MNAERENLSALVDGELSRDEVRFMLRRTGASASLRAAWTRYHVIGDGLRHEACVLADGDFVARVMQEIGNAAGATGGRVHGRGHHWLRWSAGGAIAAGVAAVALVLVQPQMRQAPATAAPEAARVAASQPATPPAQRMVAPTVPRWLSASPSAAQMAQPAAADFYSGMPAEVVPMRGYAQHVNPYMTLPGLRTPTTRDARHVMYELWSMAPRQAPPPPPVLRVQAQ